MQFQSKIFNRKALAFLICLLLASITWGINKLTKEYSYDLPYSVCVYSSTGSTTPLCATNILYIRVTAKGFYIMQHMHSPAELNVDIKKTKFSRSVDENNVVEYTLPTRLLQNSIKEAIGDAVRMEMIITETLSFDSNN